MSSSESQNGVMVNIGKWCYKYFVEKKLFLWLFFIILYALEGWAYSVHIKYGKEINNSLKFFFFILVILSVLVVGIFIFLYFLRKVENNQNSSTEEGKCSCCCKSLCCCNCSCCKCSCLMNFSQNLFEFFFCLAMNLFPVLYVLTVIIYNTQEKKRLLIKYASNSTNIEAFDEYYDHIIIPFRWLIGMIGLYSCYYKILEDKDFKTYKLISDTGPIAQKVLKFVKNLGLTFAVIVDLTDVYDRMNQTKVLQDDILLFLSYIYLILQMSFCIINCDYKTEIENDTEKIENGNTSQKNCCYHLFCFSGCEKTNTEASLKTFSFKDYLFGTKMWSSILILLAEISGLWFRAGVYSLDRSMFYVCVFMIKNIIGIIKSIIEILMNGLFLRGLTKIDHIKKLFDDSQDVTFRMDLDKFDGCIDKIMKKAKELNQVEAVRNFCRSSRRLSSDLRTYRKSLDLNGTGGVRHRKSNVSSDIEMSQTIAEE